jgi:WD40 repeat protein
MSGARPLLGRFEGVCGVTTRSVAQANEAGNAQQLTVFISYARRDAPIADRMVLGLEQHGFKVTIDRRDLPYGEEWQAELADMIRACDTVVWLVTSRSVESKWCNWELGEVARLKKRLLPVRVAQVEPAALPPSIGKVQLLPSEGLFDESTHLSVLVQALVTDWAWIRQHTRLADRARQWIEKNRATALLLSGPALTDAEHWADSKPAAAPVPAEETLEFILASRRASARRQRNALVAALAIAVLAVGLASVALWQRGLARAARDQAIEALRTQSRLIMDVSRTEAERGNSANAAMLALEGLPDRASSSAVRRDWPYVAELERQLAGGAAVAQVETALATLPGRSTAPFLYSPESGRLIVGGDLYDAASAGHLATLVSGSPSVVQNVQFAHGGQWIVAIDGDVAKLFRASDGSDISSLLPYRESVQQIFLDPAATRAVTIHRDGSVRLQRLGGSAVTIRPAPPDERQQTDIVAFGTVVFDPASRVFVLMPYATSAELWSLATDSKVADIAEPRIIRSAVFDPSGERFLSLPYQYGEKGAPVVAHLYDTRTGQPIQRFSGHSSGITDAAFSSDGARIVTGSFDNTARVWDVKSGAMLAVLAGHTTDVVQVGFVGARGDRILTRGADTTGHEQDQVFLRLWSTSGTILKEIGVPGQWVSAVGTDAAATRIAVSFSNHETGIWSLDKGDRLGTLAGHRTYVRGTLFLGGSDRLATISDDGTLRLWHASPPRRWQARLVEEPQRRSTGEMLGPNPADVVDAVLDRENQQVIAHVRRDPRLTVWPLGAGATGPAQTIPIGDKRVLALDLRQRTWAYSAEGRAVLELLPGARLDTAAASEKALVAVVARAGLWAIAEPTGAVTVRDFKGRRDLAQWSAGSDKSMRALALAPDGSRLATVSEDGVARLWDARSGRMLGKAMLGGVRSWGVLFDEARGRAIMASDDGHVAVLALDGRQLTEFSIDGLNASPRGIPPRLAMILLPRDGRIALATRHVIELRDPMDASGAGVRRLSGHAEDTVIWRDLGAVGYTAPAHVTDLALAGDGMRLVSSSEDGTARVWSLDGGEEVSVLAGHGAAVPAAVPGNITNTGVPEVYFFRSVNSVFITDDQEDIVTASDDGSVRLWPFFGSTQALVDRVKSTVPRCMTTDERRSFRLEPQPPEWCIGRRLWPYDGDAWREWLHKREAWLAGGQQGPEPGLPGN